VVCCAAQTCDQDKDCVAYVVNGSGTKCLTYHSADGFTYNDSYWLLDEGALLLARKHVESNHTMLG
jgi:hypothetical protein